MSVTETQDFVGGLIDPRFHEWSRGVRTYVETNREQLLQRYGEGQYEKLQTWAQQRDAEDQAAYLAAENEIGRIVSRQDLTPQTLHEEIAALVDAAPNRRVKGILQERQRDLDSAILGYHAYRQMFQSRFGDPDHAAQLVQENPDAVMEAFGDSLQQDEMLTAVGFVADFPGFVGEYQRVLGAGGREVVQNLQAGANAADVARMVATGLTQPGQALTRLLGQPDTGARFRKAYGAREELIGAPELDQIIDLYPELAGPGGPVNGETAPQFEKYLGARGFYLDVANHRDDVAMDMATLRDIPYDEAAAEIQDWLDVAYQGLQRGKAALPKTSVGGTEGRDDPFWLPPPSQLPQGKGEEFVGAVQRGAVEMVSLGRETSQTGVQLALPRSTLPTSKYLIPTNMQAAGELTGGLLVGIPIFEASAAIAGTELLGGALAARGGGLAARSGARALEGARTGAIFSILDPSQAPLDLQGKLEAAPWHVAGFAAFSAGAGALADAARAFAENLGVGSRPAGQAGPDLAFRAQQQELRETTAEVFKMIRQADREGADVDVLFKQYQQTVADALHGKFGRPLSREEIVDFFGQMIEIGRARGQGRLPAGVREAAKTREAAEPAAGPEVEPEPYLGPPIPKGPLTPRPREAPGEPPATTEGPRPTEPPNAAPVRPPATEPPTPGPSRTPMDRARENLTAAGVKDPEKPKTNKEARQVIRQVLVVGRGWKQSGTKNLILTSPDDPKIRFRVTAQTAQRWDGTAWRTFSSPKKWAAGVWRKASADFPVAVPEAPRSRPPAAPEAPAPRPGTAAPPPAKPPKPPAAPSPLPSGKAPTVARGRVERITGPMLAIPNGDLYAPGTGRESRKVAGPAAPLDFILEIAKRDPAFAKNPLVRVEGPQKLLVIKDGATYRLFPEKFGIDPADLTDGQEIPVDLDSLRETKRRRQELTRLPTDALERLAEKVLGSVPRGPKKEIANAIIRAEAADIVSPGQKAELAGRRAVVEETTAKVKAAEAGGEFVAAPVRVGFQRAGEEKRIVEVPGETFRGLGIHKDLEGPPGDRGELPPQAKNTYSVTHMESGMTAISGIRGKALARQIAMRLADVGLDWTLPLEKLKKKRLFKYAWRVRERLLEDPFADISDIERPGKKKAPAATGSLNAEIRPPANYGRRAPAGMGSQTITGQLGKEIPVAPIYSGKPKSPQEIQINLRRARGGLRARAQRTNKPGLLGYYAPSTQIVLKFSGDLRVDMHESAHALDDRYGLMLDLLGKLPKDVPSVLSDAERKAVLKEIMVPMLHHTTHPNHPKAVKVAEHIAEWHVAWASNPELVARQFPRMLEYVKKRLPAEVVTELAQFSTDYRTLAGASAFDQIKAKMELAKDPVNPIREFFNGTARDPEGFHLTTWDRIIYDWQNDLVPSDRAQEYLLKIKGQKELDLLPSENPKILSREYLRRERFTETWIMDGPIDWQGHRMTYPGEEHPMGMVELLVRSGIDRTNSTTLLEDINNAMTVMIAERTLEKGAQFEIDSEHKDVVTRISGIGHGIYSDRSVAERALAEYAELPSDKLDAYAEFARRYRWLGDQLLRYMRDGGRISAAQYEFITATNQHWISLQRLMELGPGEEILTFRRGRPTGGRALGAARKAVYRFKGSSRQIRNPLIGLEEAIRRSISETVRNAYIDALVELATSDRKLFQGEPVPVANVAVKSQEGQPNTVPRFTAGGKTEWWQLDPSLFKMLTGVDQLYQSHPFALEAMAQLVRITRSSVIYSPPFIGRNFVRGVQHRVQSSEFDAKIRDSFRRYGPMDIEMLKRYGGDMGGHFMRDRINWERALMSSVHHLAMDENVILATAKSLRDSYVKMAKLSEMQDRIVEFKRAQEFGRRRGWPEHEVNRYAGYKAEDLLNFSLAGRYGRILNRYFLFVNAGVQGFERQARPLLQLDAARREGSFAAAARDPEVRKARKRFLSRWMYVALLPTLLENLYAYAMGRMDELKKFPAYRRDMFWNFPLWNDLWLTVPKNFEVGVLTTGAARFLFRLSGDEHAFDGYGGSLARGMLPFEFNDLQLPVQLERDVVENRRNWPAIGGHIIPPHQQDLDFETRKEKYPEQMARASRISQLIGNAMRADPRKVDFWIESRLATTGRLALELSDAGREGKGVTVSRITGFGTTTPVWASRDVEWIHTHARKRGLTNDREYRRFEEVLDDYFDAPDNRKPTMARRVLREAEILRSSWERSE